MAILVTGGAGYIGSHTLISLADAGYETIVLDNLVNSSVRSIERVERITGKKIPFYEGDIADRDVYGQIFADHVIDACIHFAGLKAVGESVEKPLLYYRNNVSGSIVLFEELIKRNMKKIIFSSSATVYGDPEVVPLTEKCQTGGVTNPYGRTKLILEDMLVDIARSDKDADIVLLRYFNPIGAHESGSIGEDPSDIPNNLMPYITQVAVGKLPKLHVFGGDYDTPDGTGVRDYIHVCDLADGHVAALKKLGVCSDQDKYEATTKTEREMISSGIESDGVCGENVEIYNLGTGRGVSVLELIKAFEDVNKVCIPYDIVTRRAGDVASVYCDAGKAERQLGWKAKRDLREMCMDSWNWQKNNPEGYKV